MCIRDRNREVQMAAHDFGKGRAVYISGVPYSFANSRTLYRAILWSAHSEEAVSYTHLVLQQSHPL